MWLKEGLSIFRYPRQDPQLQSSLNQISFLVPRRAFSGDQNLLPECFFTYQHTYALRSKLPHTAMVSGCTIPMQNVAQSLRGDLSVRLLSQAFLCDTQVLRQAQGSLELLDVSERLPELKRCQGKTQWAVKGTKGEYFSSLEEAEKVGLSEYSHPFPPSSLLISIEPKAWSFQAYDLQAYHLQVQH